MTDLTVLISPIPLYPLTAAASGNGNGKRWSKGPSALAKPIMVTLERDVDDSSGSHGRRDERNFSVNYGNGRGNESDSRRDNGSPPRGRRGSRSNIALPEPSASSSSSSESNPSTETRKSPPRLTNPPAHVAQDPDFIHPPRRNRPRAGPPRVVDKHLLSPPVNTWKSRSPSPRVASSTIRATGPPRGNEENQPATKPKHRPTRSQSLPPDRRSFMQAAEQFQQNGQFAIQDPSQNYVLRAVPPMMPIRPSKQAEVDEKLQLPFGDPNWKGVGVGVEVLQPRTQRLVGEPEQMPMGASHAPMLSPYQLISPSVDSLGLNLGIGFDDDDDDTPLALTRLQKKFARRSFGGLGANEEEFHSDMKSVRVEPYRGKGQEVQTAPINSGFRTQPIPRASMRGGELLKPPPPLFRPTTFWRNHPRSGVASASYSPSSHLIRRATYLAAGLNFDAPVHDLSALCVESRISSIVVKSDGEGAGLI